MPGTVIWVIDTSSVTQVRRSVENSRKQQVFQSMTNLVQNGRLVYPKQLVDELERFADPNAPDAQYLWSKENQSKATEYAPSLEEVQNVLAQVPRVIDPDKDSGVEEADPYLLALAVHIKAENKDVRIVTEENKESPRKMSIRTAAGLLGIASVPLSAFLEFENIL